MAILSNLEGTMRKIFVFGKNAIRLTATDKELQVLSYDGKDTRPVVVANPSKDTHAINLGFFKANSTGSASNPIYHGTTVPSPSFGEDGHSYYYLKDDKIENIFIKIDGVWVPMNTVPEDTEDFVVQAHIFVSDWVDNADGTHTMYIPESVHNKGTDLVVQIQMLDGSLIVPALQVDAEGNITLTQTTGAVNCNVVIIGATEMALPYTGNIKKSQWVPVLDEFELSIPQSTHQQASGALFVTVYENSVDSDTSTAPWNLVGVQMQFDNASNIVLRSTKAFSGKVVIAGK